MDGMTEAQKKAELEAARQRFRATLDRAEGSTIFMVLGATVCAPMDGDEEQWKLKAEAALDNFKQAFQLLRDLVDGK